MNLFPLRKAKMTFMLVLLCILFLSVGCSNIETVNVPDDAKSSEEQQIKVHIENAINENLTLKLQSIAQKDLEGYMTTVTKNDYYYRNEQGRWFTEMTKDGMSSLSFELLDIELRDDKTAIATIRQKHVYNDPFDITYPLRYVYEDGFWVDCGYDFLEYKTSRYTVKYMEGETKLDAFVKMLDDVYDNLDSIFVEKPDEDFEIKLFHDREMLRQRTVPSLGWLFTGWGEPNESLKIYTGHDGLEGYSGTLQHEIVHHITIRLCNNNLSDWLLEGVAIYYGNAYFDRELSTTLSNLRKETVNLTIDDLKAMDLYNAKSQSEVMGWYNASYLYVAYLIETYGHDTFMDLFYEAGEKPFNNSVMNDSFESQNDETTAEVLLSVLGITEKELSDDYINWLETTDFLDNLG